MKKVRQLLETKSGKLHTIAPEARVIDALRVMADNNIGAVLVMSGSRLAGILSERDYARKVALHGKSSADVLVRDIMTANPVCVSPDATVPECMTLMTNGHFRHLPVVNDGQLTGLLSIGDLVKEVIAEQAETIKHLQDYIHS